tara:strand:+ start:202328 stop:203224 length:897 start_codon:yes stop_codon:yes gene_type:complete
MNALKAALVRTLLRMLSLLPLVFARGLGRVFGRLAWLFNGRSRRVTQRNIELAFPDQSAQFQTQLARRSLSSTAELMAETGRIWLRPWSQVSRLILQVEGADFISDALANGRGVVVLVPHLGNWEMVGLHLATLGPTVSLYEPPKLAGLGPIIEASRQRSGARLVPASRAGVAGLLRSVKAGAISGILPDQVPSAVGSGENAPFMGIPCFTATLASKVIQRTGAVAVFGFAQRVPGGFVLRYSAAQPEVYAEDVSLSLTAINRGVEACLRQCPEQYQWEYKRFRVRPKTAPGVYDDLS